MKTAIERIMKDAEEYSDKMDRRLTSYWQGLNTGHIDGAISERNKTAQEAIDILSEFVQNGNWLNFTSYKQRLERLKINLKGGMT